MGKKTNNQKIKKLTKSNKNKFQAQDTGSFLAITLGSALIHTKRNFDKLMQAQLRSVEDAKPPRRTK